MKINTPSAPTLGWYAVTKEGLHSDKFSHVGSVVRSAGCVGYYLLCKESTFPGSSQGQQRLFLVDLATGERFLRTEFSYCLVDAELNINPTKD